MKKFSIVLFILSLITCAFSFFYLPNTAEYSISYNLNGGSVSTKNAEKYTVNDSIRITDPTRYGYTFLGWTGSNGATPQRGIQIYYNSRGNRTYTANWALETYSITYNLDGGSLSSSNPSSYNINSNFTLNNPTKHGYYFLGWTGSNGSIPQKDVKILGQTGNKNYIANWEQLVNYTITYNLNGGEVSGNPTSYNKYSNFTLNNPTKSNYEFIGWTGSNGSTPQKNVTIPAGSTGNKSYTANFNAITYSITYNLNGGSASNRTSYTANDSFTLNNPTRDGYDFAGWTGSNGSTPQKTVTISRGSTGNKNYTANWTTKNYKISYDLAGGSLSSSNPTSYDVNDSFTLNNPTRDGYDFTGWTGSNGSSPQKTVKIFSGSTGNKSYTANWSVKNYTITYDLDGGTNSASNLEYYTVVTETIILASPTKENWYFAGWFDDSLFTNRVIRIIKGTTGNITLYAKWSSEPFPYILNNDGTIDFGSYPQTKVTDSRLVSSLTSLTGTKPSSSNSGTWTSYKYYIENSNSTDFMWYKDISYNGNKYRAIYFTSYRLAMIGYSSSGNVSYQIFNDYYINTLYFFKFEPINWRILTQKDGKALLMCNMIIDSQEYYNSSSSRTINGKTVYANNYAESNIRKWLNDNFYNTAFSELEKQLIELTTVDNSGNNQYACENTNDYVFLLNGQEVTNSNYGFNNSARQLKGTDYAKSQGLWVYTSSGYSYTGCSIWLLRSPSYNNSNYMRYVYCDGNSDYSYVYYTHRGVVPALWITL